MKNMQMNMTVILQVLHLSSSEISSDNYIHCVYASPDSCKRIWGISIFVGENDYVRN